MKRGSIMKKVRWGVLGTSNIANNHTVPAMQKAENASLYAVAGRSPEKTEAFLQKFGFEKACLNYEELLEDDQVDAVYISLPNSLHKEWVLKAAARGKHILCEKPLSGNPQDTKEMIEACYKAGVCFMEAFAYLHTPIIKSIKEALDAGCIGKPEYMETTYLIPTPAADNIRVNKETLGGASYDVGCYNTSLVLALLGEMPYSVGAVSEFTAQGIDLLTSAVLKFPDGKRAGMTMGFCSPQEVSRYFIHGSKGTLEAPVPFNSSGRLSYMIHTESGTDTYKFDVPDNYKLEIEQFGRCILEGEDPLVSHAFSMKVARVTEQILEAAGYGTLFA